MKINFFVLLFVIPICLYSQNKKDTVKVISPFKIDSWTIIKGKEKKTPLIVRVNSGFKSFNEKVKYPILVKITVNFKHADEDGFPTEEENLILFAIEDSLYYHLVDTKVALPVLVITANGKREYAFYTKNEKAIKANVLYEKLKIKSYDLEYYFKNDKEWAYFYKYNNLNK